MLHVPHWKILPYEQMLYVYIPFERLSHSLPVPSNSHSPVDNASRWSNTKRKHSICLPDINTKTKRREKGFDRKYFLSHRVRHLSHLTSALPTTFPRCTERSKKVLYNCNH
jgi:hypothetical protein